jgi:transcriptional regulator with XRE-family HTH domain
MRGPRAKTLGRYPNRLRELREAKGLSQEQVAGGAKMAVQTYSKLERWHSKLHSLHMRHVSAALAVHPMELFEGAPGLSQAQRDMLDLMAQLRADEQQRLLTMARAFAGVEDARAA